jgi:hypothetical protein
MFRKFRMALSMILIGVALAAGPLLAQESVRDSPAEDGRDARLRDAMQRYFEKRLRTDLGLSDAQVNKLTPLIRELEQKRNAALRERSAAGQALRRSLKQGGTDRELTRLLERLDRATTRQWEAESSLMPRVDSELSVRQRAQLRFFVQDFRREMQEKVREVRERRGVGTDRRSGRRQQRSRP